MNRNCISIEEGLSVIILQGKVVRRIKVAVIVLCCAVAFFGLIILRVYIDARREMTAARLAEGRGDMWAAVLHYRQAISAYIPLASHPEQAAEHLVRIARRAEEQGDTLLALEAYRAIRSGFLGARSFYTPGKRWIDQAEGEIVRLLIMRGEPQRVHGNLPKQELERLVRAEMNRYKPPNHLLSFVAILALFGWAISAGAGVYQLASGSYRKAMVRFAIFAAAFAVWAICLVLA